ncbi:MAG: group II intron maturase-specific domain-containing protein [Oligoflexales bacterium]
MFRAKTNDGRRTKLVFKTQSSRFTRAKQELKQKLSKAKHWPVADQARLLNSILRGHFNYYGLPGNSVCIQNFYYLAVRYWRFVLGNRSQNGRLTWEYFEQSILQVNPIVKPRLKFTYTTLKTHAML